MPSTNVFNELCVKISLLRFIPKKNITVCNTVYFRLCIDLMHILPATADIRQTSGDVGTETAEL